jgi:5'-3' exonuclease
MENSERHPKVTTPQIIGLSDFSHGLTVAFKARANDSAPNDAGQAFLNQLSEFRQMCVGTVVLCVDSGPYRRTVEYPQYKKGREREPEYAAIYRWTIERAALDGYQIASSPGEEGDDIVATLVTAYEAAGFDDIRVFTHDKDASQIISERTRVFVPKGRGEFEIRNPSWVKQKFGVEPSQMALFQGICGDPGDAIPGVKGIGAVGAAKLINAYGTVAKMAEAAVGAIDAAKMTDKPAPAFWRNFVIGIPELPKWVALTTLRRDAPLEKPPLAYLERLEVKPLVQVEPSDADDSGFELVDDNVLDTIDAKLEDINELTPEELEEERRLMAERDAIDAIIAKHPTVPRESAEAMVKMTRSTLPASGTAARPTLDAPIIGKDPKADEFLKRSAADRQVAAARALSPIELQAEQELLGRQRLAAMNTNDPKTPERVAATAARIEAGNAAEAERFAKDFARGGRGGPADTASPKEPVSGAASPTPQAAASADPKAPSGAPAAPAPSVQASAGSAQSSGVGEVVPKTQGPAKADPERLAMTVVPPPSWELATQPRSPSEMAIVAARFFNSRFYSAHGNVDGTFAVIALGRELGLGAAASVEGFHIVNQRPFAKAVMLKALAERDPNCNWLMVTSADDKHATIKTVHKLAGPLEYTYTIERAVQAGYLTGKNAENWRTKTQEMLEARATSKAVRRWYPGATFGMHSMEEAGDD